VVRSVERNRGCGNAANGTEKSRLPRRVSLAVTRTWGWFAAATSINPIGLEPASSRTFLHFVCHPLAVNIGSFFVLSLVSFRHNAAYLFHGLDGRFEVSLITLNSLFVPPLLGYTNDFLHGLGNIWFTVNPRFIPSYFLSLSGPGEFTNFALAYAICATELFFATFMAARLTGTSRLVALVAAWLVPLLSFQYAGWNLIPTTFRAFPHYATVAGVTTVAAAMLLLIGRSGPLKAALLGGLCFLAITYVIVVAPTLLILAAPQLAICGFISVVAAGSRRKAAAAFVVMAAIVAVCIVTGYVSFLIGLTSYTAANVFRGLSVRPGGLQEVSMLFWSPVRPAFFTIERSFVLLGLLGGVWAVWRATAILRLAAIAFVGAASTYLALGIAHVYHPFWFGPAFWYFEGFLFPYHAIFATLLIAEFLRVLKHLGAEWIPVAWPSRSRAVTAMLALAVATVPWLYVGHRQHVVGPPNLPFYTPHPQAETSITKILKNEIALKPGAPFRGREATLFGRMFSKSTSVDILGLSGIPKCPSGNMLHYVNRL
jgi:hypothetical protein